MDVKVISYEALKAIQIGYENHWRFRVVGHGEVPKEAYYKNEWVYEPITPPHDGTK